jgi:hypothetical protein
MADDRSSARRSPAVNEVRMRSGIGAMPALMREYGFSR